MSATLDAEVQAADDPHVEQPGPNELRDPFIRQELKRAAVWLGLASVVGLVIMLAQPLLLVFGGIVFAAMLDGGTRLLGRVLPIARPWRLVLVLLGVLAFLIWVVLLAGNELTAQAQTLQQVVTLQFDRLLKLARAYHVFEKAGTASEIGNQVMGSIGRISSVVGVAFGAVTSAVVILVIGIFLAAEPRLYERGLAWMLPMGGREQFYQVMRDMGASLRRLMAGRLLGMVIEGAGVWILLMLGGVPMAALLGVLAGLLAFVPNIGSLTSGALIILVGFSAGWNSGFYASGVYFAMVVVDGYLIVPYVAKRSVDLAPALVLGAQLLFGALLGIFGLMFADPMVAMLKVGLEHGSGRANDAVRAKADRRD